MKNILFLSIAALVLVLASCSEPVDVECGKGTVEIDGQCQVAVLECETGTHEEDGSCVADELICETGTHEENGSCVVNQDTADWFTEWQILNEPIGDLTVSDLTFTDTGFSVNLPMGQRVGIQMVDVVLEPGYYYEVTFDYNSSEAGNGIFVQLQGHGGYQFTNPEIVTTGLEETFSQILPIPPGSPGTTVGWVTIELTPSGVSGTVSIDNIELVKTALPSCGLNEVLDGIVCIPANNGFLPNGTPTAWFDGWAILSNPVGDKEISDYDFTETGFTAYLGLNERTGIELMGYVFESGYTYELTFDYTAGIANRLVWVQMEALGGIGFTNTDTWTVAGTGTFSQSITIPSTYVPNEPGWIKLELSEGALDNVTIDNIEIIVTPNE